MSDKPRRPESLFKTAKRGGATRTRPVIISRFPHGSFSSFFFVFSIGVGTLKNIRFEDLVFNRPGVIELHANTDGLAIQNVRLNFPITPDYHLLAIGPKSQTYKYGRSEDPARWTEIFSPDLDCTVRNLSVSGVRTRDSQTDLPIEQVVNVIEQKLNPDYPMTTPKGGTGKGIWIR